MATKKVATVEEQIAELQKQLEAANEAAAKADATDEQKAAPAQLQTQLNELNQQKQSTDTAAEQAAAAAKAKPEVSKETSPEYVPVFTLDGEAIARNSQLFLHTTGNFNLKSLDGLDITPTATAAVNGPDLVDGDWYTEQFRAGLIAVDHIKKIK